MANQCTKCGNMIGYMQYYCTKCKKELAGQKPKKSRDMCAGCRNNFYNNKYSEKNPFGSTGCMSYKGATVKIVDFYYHLNQVVPNPRWKLSCYHKQY